MKKIQWVFLVAAICIPFSGFAQKNIDVQENVMAMSLGDRTGYSINISDMNEKDAVKVFKTWVTDQNKKTDIKESDKHELSIAAFPFNGGTAQAYFTFLETKSGMYITGFFEPNGTFISSATDPAGTALCKTVMLRLGQRYEKTRIEDQLALAQKDLEKRKGEQTDLEKKNKSLNDDIDEWTKAIEKAKADLEQNAKDQEAKKQEITKQQTILEGIQEELKKYDDK